MSNRLIVVSGPPGAGKSTIAHMLAARFDPSVLVTGDRFFGFLANGFVEPWRIDQEDAAGLDFVPRLHRGVARLAMNRADRKTFLADQRIEQG